jgi:RES domain-containing protein
MFWEGSRTAASVKCVYRVLRKPFARSPFDGEGAYLYGGRWSSKGVRIAYTSEHQSLAMLEYFVHLDSDNAPPDLVLVVAEIPGDVRKRVVTPKNLPSNWRHSPSPAELSNIGDEFIQKAEHCILIVPSALAPSENNWLLNPQHADFRKILPRKIESLKYDPRMFDSHRRRRRADGR